MHPAIVPSIVRAGVSCCKIQFLGKHSIEARNSIIRMMRKDTTVGQNQNIHAMSYPNLSGTMSFQRFVSVSIHSGVALWQISVLDSHLLSFLQKLVLFLYIPILDCGAYQSATCVFDTL